MLDGAPIVHCNEKASCKTQDPPYPAWAGHEWWQCSPLLFVSLRYERDHRITNILESPSRTAGHKCLSVLSIKHPRVSSVALTRGAHKQKGVAATDTPLQEVLHGIRALESCVKPDLPYHDWLRGLWSFVSLGHTNWCSSRDSGNDRHGAFRSISRCGSSHSEMDRRVRQN